MWNKSRRSTAYVMGVEGTHRDFWVIAHTETVQIRTFTCLHFSKNGNISLNYYL